MTTRLIGLAGAKRSGKNTAAKMLAELNPRLHVVERAFAAPLKIAVARLFGGEGSDEDLIAWADEFKEHGTVASSLSVWHVPHRQTGREILQRFGTEVARQTFGEDFWIDLTLPLNERRHVTITTAEGPQEVTFGDGNLADRDEAGKVIDLLVVTDVRFENEAVRVHENGGEVWQIVGGQSVSGDTHSSETPLPAEHVDVVIENHGSLADLTAQIRNQLNA